VNTLWNNPIQVCIAYFNTQYPRVDVDFSATNRTEETVQIVLTRDVTNALNITAVELVFQARFGEEFNRRLDLIASRPNMTSFTPREWDECGRKDDFVSTVLL